MRNIKHFEGFTVNIAHMPREKTLGFIGFSGGLLLPSEIPALIKWLEKVQKYNEFKNKKKKVKNGSKSKRD